jgi:hypothetical protein
VPLAIIITKGDADIVVKSRCPFMKLEARRLLRSRHAHGVQYGFELQACRPATVSKWVHDNISAPLGMKLQVAGVSAGSTQIAYAMSSYWLDSMIDVAVLIVGPPFASLCAGCLQQSGYAYDTRNA